MRLIVAAVLLLTVSAAVSIDAQAQEYNPARRLPRGADTEATDRIIVKWRGAQARSASATVRNQKATAASGMSMRKLRALTTDTDVMELPQKLSGAALSQAVARLESDPNVEYASPDTRQFAHAMTSDPRLMEQWYLLGDQASATRTDSAWDTTRGSASIVVAVLDTGVRPEHPDLAGKLLDGYDFVSIPLFANDGDGRDADASDPGDWVDSTDKQNSAFGICDVSKSSWHGTRVSGLIGAATNNGVGVAGAGWNTRILPVRVLGKCGGSQSDIIDGMRWAAGLSVPDVPLNRNPAKIINLSLGGTGVCSSAYQDAVNQVTAQGVLVVASAGNESGPVAAPANCNGVLGVAGLRHAGTKVGFSSIGPQVGISAPGGNCVNVAQGQTCVFSILVPINTGATVPVDSDYSGTIIDNDDVTADYNLGTSFSAPLAAAAAALVQAVRPSLTPAQTASVLKESASAFTTGIAGVQNCRVPTSQADLQGECACTTSTCGAGMLNTNAAIAALQGPLAVISTSGTVTSGSTLTLDAGSSFSPNGRTLVTYQWSVTNVTGAAPTLAAADQSATTLQITGDGTFTLQLTVTDDQGAMDSDVAPMATVAAAPPSNQPSFSNRGGGGGGSFGWELLALALLVTQRRLRKSAT